ncbi:hypothetical protein JOM56_013985 [Amanita muscaria]
MRGGFYLSLSQLYSCLRLSADKQSYDVPIPGDWATIAVLAEIGGVRDSGWRLPLLWSWCDTKVCDWHMQRAMESRRSGGAEFSVETTGMSTSAAVRKGRKGVE